VPRSSSSGWIRLSGRGLRRNLVAVVLAAGAVVLAGFFQLQAANALYPGGPLHALESSAQDAALRTRDPGRNGSSVGRDPRQLITLVAIDEKSLSELGLFRSWPRSYYAQVIDQLLAAPPRVITMDVGFFEPGPDDAELAAAIARARGLRPPTAVGLAAAGEGDATRSTDNAVAFASALEPVVTLLNAGPDVGMTNVLPDDRGVVRSMPLLADVGGVQHPTLGLLAAARYLRRPGFVDGRPDPATVLLAGRQIPVDPASALSIDYFGPPSDPAAPSSTFRTVSFVDVLRGRADPSTWRDGIAFIGLLGATGFADDYWTPVSDQGRKMSGVEIHANVAATLLSTQFLHEAPYAAQLALIAALALVLGLVAANLDVFSACAVGLAVLVAYLLANLVILDQAGLQLALATPALSGVLAFFGVITYRVVIEQRQARALQTALASVIPPRVAQEIGRNPQRVRLGGERRVITVLFTDLIGFTSFSETIEPELLSRVITDYLDAMSNVVFELGGTLDKFVGDAVMAFWNAPLDDPLHAWHACEAALRMRSALSTLSDRWQAEGLPRQRMRIGINTGPASVGNMGSTRRFAYTALGDAVNLAARLEPLNDEYGTTICMSQNTLDSANASHGLLVRFLDLVQVKGKRLAVPVFELIGRADDPLLAAQQGPMLDLFARAMVLYQAQQFSAAEELFLEASTAAGDGVDEPSAVYVDRCRELALEPPGAGWDRVYVMKHK
jgi:adenylate cyclase